MAIVVPQVNLFRPANNGTGKRIWFIYADTGPTMDDRYECTPSGAVKRYATYEQAQAAADRRNRTTLDTAIRELTELRATLG
jgi:hypothetical protein